MTDPDIVTRLRDCTCIPHGELCRESADEIERLRAERDEARREVCRLSQQAHNIACELSRYPKNAPTPQEYATALGWDCFKEDR